MYDYIPGVEGVLAGVLENHLAGDLGVASAAVLVGPLDGQNAPGVVVHSLVLSEGGNIAGVTVQGVERSSAIFGLEIAVSDTAGAGVATIVVILTDNK